MAVSAATAACWNTGTFEWCWSKGMSSRRYIGQSAIVTGGGLGMGRAIALHVPINNAGIMHPDDDLLEHASDAAWDRTLAVNFHGPFHCCRFSIPHLLASGGGAIVSIASVGGVMGTTRPLYGAGKGAVIGMTTLIARQYAAQGLRANVVLPAGVNTPMLDVVMKYQRTVRQPVYNPMQRVAESGEIAGVVAYLASADAAGVNGALWPADGGTLAV